jgi:flavorubredoxin
MTGHDFEGTRVDEIFDGIFRIGTAVPSIAGGGITFNQYLLVDDEPLLFHTGKRRMFPQVREAVAHVLPLERLRWISFSHFEADECGALNELLAVAPYAVPLCGHLLAMLSVNDVADREARILGDGEIMQTGKFRLQWLDTPHLPHGWEAGLIMEHTTGTLLCSDLFADGGTDHPPLFEGDILGPSDAFRRKLGDFYTHTKQTRGMLTRLSGLKPTTLARMHGSAWRGDGAKLLLDLADTLDDGGTSL